ncbi:right-handed parallel beta-helix repeat-containing protein [Kribbella deserti]|uniref:Right-handed parallel beta-helix repeat-containing protein n=1 Tax=Kribbella deserti TaxID=1926257 RepID=A0ABV6QNF1_9ACTN
MTTTRLRQGGLWVRRGHDPVDPEPAYDYVVNGGDLADIQTVLTTAGTNKVILVRPKAGGAPYRGTTALVPLAGQKILGQTLSNGDRTVLSGSLELNGTWTSDGAGHWWHATTLPDYTEPTTVQCELTNGSCRKRESVWVNGQLLRRVMTMAELDTAGDPSLPGRFYQDYAADRTYINVNPSGKLVEIAKAPQIISTAAWQVKVVGIVAKHAASPSQQGAVWLRGIGCEVAYSDLSDNRAIGLYLADSNQTWVHHNTFLRDGQMGGSNYRSHGTLWEFNEFAYNNTGGYRPDDWESGAIKISSSVGARFQDNYSHHNRGLGCWVDIDNENTKILRNRIEYNYADGIRHEISWGGEIAHNYVAYNGYEFVADHAGETGFTGYSGFAGGGININNSADVYVHHNILGPNQNGIFAQHRGNRGPSTAHPNWETRNLLVELNDVTIVSHTTPAGYRYNGTARPAYTSGLRADENISGIGTLSTADPAPYMQSGTGKNNTFRNNTYRAEAPGRANWMLNGGQRTWTNVQSAGQELGGTLLSAPRPGWQITAGADDGNWRNTVVPDFSATRTKIYLGDVTEEDRDRHAWLRFTGITIPKNATIIAARLHLYGVGRTGGLPPLTINAEKAGNSFAPTTRANVNAKPRTTTQVPWTLTSWLINAWNTSPDIAAVLQELVNQTDWVSGNALTVFVNDAVEGLVGGAAAQVVFNGYETDPALSANLQVSWTA